MTAYQRLDLEMRGARDRYESSWRSVEEYLDAIPDGFVLDKLGAKDVRDETVRRLGTWQEAESTVHFDPDDGSPDTSSYLRLQVSIGRAAELIRDLAGEASLVDAVQRAADEAGARYASDKEDLSDSFFVWCASQPEISADWYGSDIQDHARHIGAAIAFGRRPETEVIRQMWYWYRAGYWPCGWEGHWPEGKLIVF